ncbi:DUF2442 domain-containing protein [Pararhizobium sp. DWP1-1-3]|uniref:DUF2442 domain-containing protein n=1 Tax=Pararhizobium sp. DWP1-1-3 TaxID=2804652 RepID=UPI003CEF076B
MNNVVVAAKGLGLHWPDIDADLYVPSLMDGILGSRKWMEAQLGSTGGKVTSGAKAASSRLNGLREVAQRRISLHSPSLRPPFQVVQPAE